MLAVEVWEKILVSVSIKDAIVLNRTCIQWYNILTSSRYWLMKGREMGYDLRWEDFEYHQRAITPVIREVSFKSVTYGSENFQDVRDLIKVLLRNKGKVEVDYDLYIYLIKKLRCELRVDAIVPFLLKKILKSVPPL